MATVAALRSATTLAAKGPERLLLLVSFAAWGVLLSWGGPIVAPGLCGLSAEGWLGRGWRELEATLLLNAPGRLAVHWLAMLTAMTPPLLSEPLTHLWRRSLARRRARAITLFLLAYGAVWMLAGTILVAAAVALSAAVGSGWLGAPTLGLGVALLWQASPARQACLNRCHRRPGLSAFSVAADRDSLRFGLVSGAWCIGTCWALMLAALSVGAAHIVLMTAGMAVSVLERRAPPQPPRWRIPIPRMFFRAR